MAQPPNPRRRDRRASFTVQFALILLGVGLATAIAGAAVAWYETQTVSSGQMLGSAARSARLAVGVVRLETASVSSTLACELAPLPRTAGAFQSGKSGLTSLAQSVVEANPGHYLIFTDGSGAILAGATAGVPLSSFQALLKQAFNPIRPCSQGGSFLGMGRTVLGVGLAPVSSSGRTLGYVVAITPVTRATLSFTSRLLSSQIGGTEVLLASGGRADLTGRTGWAPVLADSPIPSVVAQALTSRSGAGSVTVGGHAFTVAGQPIRTASHRALATVIVSRPSPGLAPSAAQLGIPVALAVACVLLLGLVVVFLLAERYLNRPLKRLNEAVQRLGQDVYAEPVVIDGAEEITRLAANFEIMRRRLRHQLVLAVGRSVIASTLTGNAPLEQVLTQVLMNLCRVLEVEMAAILLRSDEQNQPHLLITWGMGNPSLDWSELERSPGLVGSLLREPRFVSRSLLSSTERGPLEVDLGLRDCLAEPLAGEGKDLGVLIVANKQAPYLDEDSALCNAVAVQVVAAVEKSRQLVVTRHEATTDAMTGLYNYRFLIGYLDQQVNVAERADANLSVLMLDLDHFKSVNDSHGHLAGDAVLRAVSNLVVDTIRKSDLAARYGGEEFVVVMSNTGREEAQLVAEKIRQAVAGLSVELEQGVTVEVTISIGGVSFPEGTRGARNLLDLADRALYQAKRDGRNRVEFLDLAAAVGPGSGG
ncbi:MAG: GGDEF domain-containing protein [Candidatus Dormibacteria bacterium]